jgi:hypothetical protein
VRAGQRGESVTIMSERPEAPGCVRALVYEELPVFDRGFVVIHKRADIDGRAAADEDKVVFVGVAVPFKMLWN